MKKNNPIAKNGFTLIELMVTVAISTIVLLALAVTLIENQKSWSRMFARVNSDVITDAYVAQRAFDSIVRKSTIKSPDYGSGLESATLYYYNDPNTSVALDRYAIFALTEDERLEVTYGTAGFNLSGYLEPKSVINSVTLARNVKSASFSVAGASLEMFLALDNDEQSTTLTCSAFRHNN